MHHIVTTDRGTTARDDRVKERAPVLDRETAQADADGRNRRAEALGIPTRYEVREAS